MELEKPYDPGSRRSQDVRLSPDSVLFQLRGSDVLDTPAVFGPRRDESSRFESRPPIATCPVAVRLREGCDEYYAIYLTPADVIRLGEEFIALGKMAEALHGEQLG